MRKIVCILITAAIPGLLFAQFRMVGEPVIIFSSGNSDVMSPKWSPDGRYIAFTSRQYNGIWIVETKTGDFRQVTDDIGAGFGFRWSGDSRELVSRIAVYSFFRRRNGLKIYNIAQGTERMVLDVQPGFVGLPRWCDADEKIIAAAGNQVALIESGKKASILQKQHAAERICFLSESKIGVKNIRNDSLSYLDPLAGERYINLEMSPDGTRLVFEIVGGNLYVVQMDGSGLIDLGTGYRPQWSPDSRYIVYMITEDDGHKFTKSDLYIIRDDGTEKTRLTYTEDILEMNPSWSPDGDTIAYDVPEGSAIYAITITRYM
ncbi:PD40 domain-containing protein [bacterium]|nr:PD40 domain-containing protein [bacterium]